MLSYCFGLIINLYGNLQAVLTVMKGEKQCTFITTMELVKLPCVCVWSLTLKID